MSRYAPTPGGRQNLDATLIRGVGVVAVFAMLTGAARLGQDAVIASQFGTGPIVDAYFFLLSLANWPVAVTLSTLIVLYAPTDAALERGNAATAQRFRAELLGWTLLAAIISLPLAWWTLQAITASRLGGLEPATEIQAIEGIPGLVAVVPLGILVSLLSAWFIATSRHTLALIEALPSLVLISAILFLPGSLLFWGTSAGIGMQLLVMLLVLRQAGELPSPRIGFSSTGWPGFSQGAIAVLAGQVLFALVPIIDAFFAARIGDGTISSLSYANRLLLGAQGLAGLALQRVGLPILSRISTESRVESLGTAQRWAFLAAFGGGLVSLATLVVADPLVSLLFERGNFSPSDRQEVATLLRFGALQLPIYLCGITFITALASINARQALARIAITGLLTKIVCCVVLVPVGGAKGLQIATALMYITTSTLAWVTLRHRHRTVAS